MRPILDQSAEALQTWMLEHDQRPYRAAQIRKWLYAKRASSWEQMTDLPRGLREQLAAEFNIWSAEIAIHRKDDDGTEKLLLTLAEARQGSSDAPSAVRPEPEVSESDRAARQSAGTRGAPAPLQIECVLLRDDKGHCSMCISTQVGCAMKCAFCATGLGGMTRNLTTGEILEQMLQLQRLLKPEERLSHIVCMGMGEPLANLDRLMPALSAASAKDGLGIGVRKVTISTVGLPAGIRRLAERNCQYHLAVSLHAPNDELRTQLMPTNRNIGIDAIMAAADEYFERTGRRVTYEYILLAGVNDGPVEAKQLVALLRGRPSLVNLIPYNPVRGLKFRTPHPSVVARFVEILEQGGLNVAIRHRKGARIDAACGQLRRAAASREVVVGISASPQ
jgi:23S rRNA (adenine2503-C2)-methyltransferase